MENWNANLNKIKKDPRKYRLFKVIQLINYGPGKEKLSLAFLKKNWDYISQRIDPFKKRVLDSMINQ